MGPRFCYKCGEEGHTRRRCLNPPNRAVVIQKLIRHLHTQGITPPMTNTHSPSSGSDILIWIVGKIATHSCFESQPHIPARQWLAGNTDILQSLWQADISPEQFSPVKWCRREDPIRSVWNSQTPDRCRRPDGIRSRLRYRDHLFHPDPKHCFREASVSSGRPTRQWNCRRFSHQVEITGCIVWVLWPNGRTHSGPIYG